MAETNGKRKTGGGQTVPASSVPEAIDRNRMNMIMPPQSPDAERALIISLICHASGCDDVRLIVDDDCFYSIRYRMVFRAILSLYDAGRPVDAIAVVAEIGRIGGWSKEPSLNAPFDGEREAAELLITDMQGTQSGHLPMAYDAVSNAKIIRATAMRRKAMETAYQCLMDAADEAIDPNDMLSRATRGMEHAESLAMDAGSAKSIDDILIDAIMNIDKKRDDPNLGAGFKSNLQPLDYLIGGFGRGELSVIGARPGMGKTIELSNMICEAGKSGHRTYLLSLEMAQNEFTERLLSRETRIRGDQLRKGTIDESERFALMQATEEMSKWPVDMDFPGSMTIREVGAMLRHVKRRRGGLDLVVIDYLQLIEGSGGGRQTRIDAVGEVSRKLKGLAKDLDCHIMVACQLNRESEGRENKRPRLSDLRESGAIEQDADQVILLYRPYYYFPEDKNPNYLEMIIAKNRHGNTGTARVHIRMDCGLLSNPIGSISEDDAGGSPEGAPPDVDYDRGFGPGGGDY